MFWTVFSCLVLFWGSWCQTGQSSLYLGYSVISCRKNKWEGGKWDKIYPSQKPLKIHTDKDVIIPHQQQNVSFFALLNSSKQIGVRPHFLICWFKKFNQMSWLQSQPESLQSSGWPLLLLTRILNIRMQINLKVRC